MPSQPPTSNPSGAAPPRHRLRSPSPSRPTPPSTAARLLSVLAALPLFASAQPGAQPAVTPDSSAAQPTTLPPALDSHPLIQQLIDRIQDLERREAQRAQETDQQSRELTRKLQDRILELEDKVRSLESGKVLPEIAIAPEDGPTPIELDEKLRHLQREHQLAQEAAAARLRDTPQLSVGPAGFEMTSADTNFFLRLGGLAQADSRTFLHDHPLADRNDSLLLRRGRLSLEGTVYRDFDFRLNTEFAGPNGVQMLDADVSYSTRPEWGLRVGRFKSPVGAELLLPVEGNLFNERSIVTELVPNRTTGAQIEGEVAHGRLQYAAGVFSPTGDKRVGGIFDQGDSVELAGRLQSTPWRHSSNSWLSRFSVGVAGSFTQISSNAIALPNPVGGTEPGYLTPAGQQFFAYNSPAGPVVADGPHWRLSPHATYLKGPFGLMGEYLLTEQGVLNATTLRQAQLRHSGWQLSAQWVLSGEPASFHSIVPLRPFRPATHQWGAWQLVARFSGFDADPNSFLGFSNPDTSARRAASWQVGVNWWLNRNLRVLTSFSRTTFDGGGKVNLVDPTSQRPPGTTTARDELAFLTRLQLAF